MYMLVIIKTVNKKSYMKLRKYNFYQDSLSIFRHIQPVEAGQMCIALGELSITKGHLPRGVGGLIQLAS